jgi:hypothetical protein
VPLDLVPDPLGLPVPVLPVLVLPEAVLPAVVLPPPDGFADVLAA